MHTGNISTTSSKKKLLAVYPCAYREHDYKNNEFVSKLGLSLCIQGTYVNARLNQLNVRFIPVHTGNIDNYSQWIVLTAVYPCAYREHMLQINGKNLVYGLSLCIQGTF